MVPYTKSTMSFFELYRMNVPLFYPSVALLTKWELGIPTSTKCSIVDCNSAHTALHFHVPTWLLIKRGH